MFRPHWYVAWYVGYMVAETKLLRITTRHMSSTDIKLAYTKKLRYMK